MRSGKLWLSVVTTLSTMENTTETSWLVIGLAMSTLFLTIFWAWLTRRDALKGVSAPTEEVLVDLEKTSIDPKSLDRSELMGGPSRDDERTGKD